MSSSSSTRARHRTMRSAWCGNGSRMPCRSPRSAAIPSPRCAPPSTRRERRPAPRGGRLRVLDARGQIAFDIAADGAVTGYGYDASGNVTKSVRYRSTLAASDLPSHAAMATWAANNASDAGNRIARHYHSARDGELRMTVDALGYVTRYDYDAEGRVVETIRSTTPP
ncbi:hypothetical protein AB5I41_23585 [Sphingomonas sp. MMS24-JH45]